MMICAKRSPNSTRRWRNHFSQHKRIQNQNPSSNSQELGKKGEEREVVDLGWELEAKQKKRLPLGDITNTPQNPPSREICSPLSSMNRNGSVTPQLENARVPLGAEDGSSLGSAIQRMACSKNHRISLFDQATELLQSQIDQEETSLKRLL
mmetsp:Transcript_44833/g.62815  ORF Transcript_44833/g.62815 Transcript_44833/m.62815 type:complete len:151 (+) Transcript_44833:1656-2108(+)